MIIEKIVNNNCITTFLENGDEAVLMGSGVGFKKRVGESVDKKKIEKIFKLDNPATKDKIREILETTNPECFLITQSIIEYAEKNLDNKLSEMAYVLITDHLFFAMERCKQNAILENPMLWEIKNLYSEEYKIGIWALRLIEERFGMRLPEDEAAFIALHIVNAALGEEIYNTTNITILIKNILKIIKNHYVVELEEDSLDYVRLVTHLKFFTQRLFKREQIKTNEEIMYSMVKEYYKEEEQCVLKISKYIKKQFNYDITQQEKLYLILHIRKITKK